MNELNTLQSELEHLRAEVQALRKEKAVRDFDNQRLHVALDRTIADRDYHFRRATEVKSLLDSTGAMLVRGINAFNENGHDQVVEEKQLSLTHNPEPEPAESKFQAAVAKAIGDTKHD